MPLLNLGKEGKEDKNRSRDEPLDKQRSKSLASYIDLEKKIKHEEEQKFKRVQRDREKMAEAEKKLKRAQERAAIELKRLQALGAGKGVSVAGVSSSGDKAVGGKSQFDAGIVFAKNPTYVGFLCILLGLTYVITISMTGTEISTYTRDYQAKNKLTRSDANALTDTAQSGCTGIAACGVLLFLMGSFLLFQVYTNPAGYKASDGTPYPYNPNVNPAKNGIFIVFMLLNIIPCIVFLTTILSNSWYSELENSAPTFFAITSGVTSLVSLGYLLFEAQGYQKKRLEAAGIKAVAVSSAAKVALAGVKK